jgi:hypothetical protein
MTVSKCYSSSISRASGHVYRHNEIQKRLQNDGHWLVCGDPLPASEENALESRRRKLRIKSRAAAQQTDQEERSLGFNVDMHAPSPVTRLCPPVQ